MSTNKIEQPTVVSIGTNEVNKVVIRMRFADNSIRDFATDLVSFATLAAKGVPVQNVNR